MTPVRYHIKMTDGKRERGHVITVFSFAAAKAAAERRAAALGREWKIVDIEEVPEAA